MELIIGLSLVITIIYGLLKSLEYYFYSDSDKEEFTMKYLTRNVIMVLISSFASVYVFFHYQIPIQDFINVITQTKTTEISQVPPILTDDPNF